ncbi:hypothetical protein NMY22_g275 [Coprinellus aureogranulatus]|nr:hypothetical protein NMY22_g275 [Coprinellus aureogranulatus]
MNVPPYPPDVQVQAPPARKLAHSNYLDKHSYRLLAIAYNKRQALDFIKKSRKWMDQVEGGHARFLIETHQDPLASDPPTLSGDDHDSLWKAFLPTRIDYRETELQQCHPLDKDAAYLIAFKWEQGWIIKETVVHQWKIVEDRLLLIIPLIRSIVTTNIGQIPLPPTVIPGAYAQSFPDIDAAKEAIARASRSFRCLEAYLAFLLSFFRAHDMKEQKILELTLWLRQMLSHSVPAVDIDEQWLFKLLLMHPIGPSARVAYLGIDILYTSPWVSHIPAFINNGVPVFVRFNMKSHHMSSVLPLDICQAFFPVSRPCSAECRDCRRVRDREAFLASQTPSTYLTQRQGVAWRRGSAQLPILPTRGDVDNPDLFVKLGYDIYIWYSAMGVHRRMMLPRLWTKYLMATYPAHNRYYDTNCKTIDFSPVLNTSPRYLPDVL